MGADFRHLFLREAPIFRFLREALIFRFFREAPIFRVAQIRDA